MLAKLRPKLGLAQTAEEAPLRAVAQVLLDAGLTPADLDAPRDARVGAPPETRLMCLRCGATMTVPTVDFGEASVCAACQAPHEYLRVFTG